MAPTARILSTHPSVRQSPAARRHIRPAGGAGGAVDGGAAGGPAGGAPPVLREDPQAAQQQLLGAAGGAAASAPLARHVSIFLRALDQSIHCARLPIAS